MSHAVFRMSSRSMSQFHPEYLLHSKRSSEACHKIQQISHAAEPSLDHRINLSIFVDSRTYVSTPCDLLGSFSRKMESSTDLRSMIQQTLTMIITPDQQLIEKGQVQLQALELLETYTLALTEITVDSTRDISVRQLAGVLLRKYISKHWTKDIENFVEPEVPDQVSVHASLLDCCSSFSDVRSKCKFDTIFLTGSTNPIIGFALALLV